jgi:hypothetical protein
MLCVNKTSYAQEFILQEKNDLKLNGSIILGQKKLEYGRKTTCTIGLKPKS